MLSLLFFPTVLPFEDIVMECLDPYILHEYGFLLLSGWYSQEGGLVYSLISLSLSMNRCCCVLIISSSLGDERRFGSTSSCSLALMIASICLISLFYPISFRRNVYLYL